MFLLSRSMRSVEDLGETFPDPRGDRDWYGGDLTGPYSGPVAGLSPAESGLCAALGAGVGSLGYSVEVMEPAHGLSLRGTRIQLLAVMWSAAFGPDGTAADVCQPTLLPLRSPAWRSQCASAPRAGLSSSRGESEAEARAQKVAAHWWAGTTSRLAFEYSRSPGSRQTDTQSHTTRVEVTQHGA